MRCRYCDAQMSVTAAAYAVNPWCDACLSERLHLAADGKGPGRLVPVPGTSYLQWVLVPEPEVETPAALSEFDTLPWRHEPPDQVGAWWIRAGTDAPRVCYVVDLKRVYDGCDVFDDGDWSCLGMMCCPVVVVPTRVVCLQCGVAKAAVLETDCSDCGYAS